MHKFAASSAIFSASHGTAASAALSSSFVNGPADA